MCPIGWIEENDTWDFDQIQGGGSFSVGDPS